jgi:hypothetical protein
MDLPTKSRWPLSEKVSEMSMFPDWPERVPRFIFLKIRDFS